MRIRRWLLFGILLSFSTVMVCGCVSLFPKRDTMRTSITRTTNRKTSAPRVFMSGGQLVAVGQEETVQSEVEYSKATPVSASRSIWNRWTFWLLILVGITYLGLWPVVIKLLKKLREKTHALVTLVGQVDVFKEKAAADPKGPANDVNELKTILKAQDPMTKAQVDKIRNGK